MEKKKLITALMVGCMAFLPAKSADVNITEGVSGAISQAITNETSDTMYIQNGLTFSNNQGATSGCIFNKGELVINDGTESSHTTFQGNTINSSWGGGGAINSYNGGGTSVYVGDYTSFIENSSANQSGGDSGGAIYVGDSSLTIGDHVNFYKNSTPANGTTFGGAVFIQNSETKIGNYINVEENSAKSGGGLSINNSNIADPVKSLVTIGTNANFENNKAENGDGGAISIENTSLKIENTASFSGNSATNNGGAINSTGSADTTTITIGSGSSFTGNSATNSGGAIYNTATVNVNGATFSENKAANGGAIYNTATVNVNGATFSGNKAANGGALYNAQNATASLQDVTFSAASGDASNSIYNAGSVTTASTGNNTNLFASTTTIDGDWTYGGNNNVTGNIDGSGKIINEGNTTFAGNNSQFTGSFTQSDSNAETTVTGTFFGGSSTVSNGTLNWETQTGIPSGGKLNITGGNLNIGSADGQTTGKFTVGTNSAIGDAVNVQVNENSAFIVKNGTFSLNSINGKGVVDADGVMHASLVDVANGQRVQHSITELAIDTQTNFNIDIHARGNHYTSNDQFVVSSMTGDGTARIDNWGLNGDIFGWDAPIDRNIILDHIFVDENGNPLEGNIEITRRTEFTPIGYYQLNQHGSGSGLHYSLDLVDFNPQVFRGQVATVAQWMNQLAIDDMLFTHSMVLPSFKDEDGGVAYSGVMANRYASSNPLFAPYQYSRKDGGLWYKMYGTFENLNMNVSGLGRVGNNAYGALIGADFGLKELKNGWKFMPTAYVGYNGAHQAYPGIGAYQNGGQAGFLGTWYKNNFILGGLVYGGVYENSMDVAGHVDNAFNYFAGAATKFAYNWRFHRDWVLQPNLMAAYNFFGQQNWHSDYGQMGMMAGMLNGVNIAPGVNLIWEKETFSIYGTLQYMYNVNGAVGGRAGNVGLPQVEMERGYIQYGLGFNKRWGERFSGYLQAVLRNVGRTGVGFQLGFNFLLGK